MVRQAKRPPHDALADLSRDELVALVLRLQDQFRQVQAENERLREGAFTRWDRPVPGETDEERTRRITGDPRVRVHRRAAGPVPSFEPISVGAVDIDVLDLLGKREGASDEPQE
jgi:hypothetical protein